MQQLSPPTTGKPNENPMLTPDEFRNLVIRVRRDSRRAAMSELMRPFVGIILMVFVITGGYRIIATNILMPLILVASTMMFISSRAGRYFRNTRSQAKRLTQFVENTQDARQLGVILELHYTANRLDEKWNGAYAGADAAVLRLLPSLQAGDAEVLNTQQREHLRRFLLRHRTHSNSSHWPVPEYCLPVLAALEQIGDKRDLPDVEQLAKIGSLNVEVCTAAKRCAQVIRERLDRESISSVLLRPDRKPEAVEALLRPATENASIPPQQLLRAAASDESNPPM